MKEAITSYVALDIHKDPIAIAIASGGAHGTAICRNDQPLALGAVQDAEAPTLQP